MALHQELVEFGFDDKKAKIYLALLELGEAKAYDIAKKAVLERPTTYDILEKLSNEGLVGSYEKRGVRYFVPERPERIKQILSEKQQRLEKLLPELQSVYNTLKSKPAIRFFEGVEGVKTVFEDIITAQQKELRGILSMADLYKIPGRQYIDDYVKRRIQQGYHLRAVRSKTKETASAWLTSLVEKRELRYAPQPMVFAMTLYLYDNKVGIISTEKENFGMIIESEEFANTMGHLFEALWQVSSAA